MAIRNLTITVIDGGKGNFKSNKKNNPINKSNDEGSRNLKNVINMGDTIKMKMKSSMTPTSYFALQYGTKIATNTVKQVANYYISDIGRSNGDSNYQAIVNKTIEQVSDVMSIGGGILSGAQMGTMIMPGIGTAVGAVMGAISSGLNVGFKYIERNVEYQHTMFEKNNSQAYNLARANYSALTGRVR